MPPRRTSRPAPVPAPSLPPQTYLTAKEVAVKLHLSAKSVYTMALCRLLPHRRRGRRVGGIEQALDGFLAALPGCRVDHTLARVEEEGCAALLCPSRSAYCRSSRPFLADVARA